VLVSNVAFAALVRSIDDYTKDGLAASIDYSAWPVAAYTLRARELFAAAGGHADDERHTELPSRHVPDRGGRVEDRVERQEREVDRHDLDDGTHPRQCRANPRARECGFGKRRVANALEKEGLEDGRKAVSQIVGRDPNVLDEAGVSRAANQSLSENFPDGLVSPPVRLGGCPRRGGERCASRVP